MPRVPEIDPEAGTAVALFALGMLLGIVLVRELRRETFPALLFDEPRRAPREIDHEELESVEGRKR